MTTDTQNIPASAAAPKAPLEVVGILAEFGDVDSVCNAARKVRSAGYKVWDVHSPFPIHGIDAIIGIRPTILPWIVCCSGVTGLISGLLLQWWTNAHDYPFLISGKPFWSLAANIPIIFECTVLFSALAAVSATFGLSRLPQLYNPLFKSERFRRVTNDKFFIWIDKHDAKFDTKATAEFLTSIGAAAVEQIED